MDQVETIHVGGSVFAVKGGQKSGAIDTTGSPAILAVTAPKNNEEELALGNQLFTALRLPLRGRWSDRKPKLMGSMVQFGVKCLIMDDAQDLSLPHLMFIKELTDQGRLHYGYPLGLCLVTAGRGNTIPLKEILDQPETMWLQFRRRLDKLEPFCRVEGHTSEEVREILAALETVYREPLPHLNLRQCDGAGPSVEVQESDPTTQGSRTEPEQEAVPPTQQQDTTETVGDQKQPTKPTKCTFSGVVPIEAQRFLDGGTLIVECPECAATRSLEPRRGVLRFPSHDKRKTRTTPPGQRWVKRETAWEVAGG